MIEFFVLSCPASLCKVKKSSSMLWLGCEMPPHRLMDVNTWAPTGGAVWNIVESLRWRTVLEKVGHWGSPWGHIAWPHLLLALSFLTTDAMWPATSGSCSHAFPDMIDYTPKLWYRTPKTKTQNNFPLLSSFLSGVWSQRWKYLVHSRSSGWVLDD